METYVLKKPVEWGEARVEELKVSPLTAGAMDEMPVDQSTWVFGHWSKVIAHATKTELPIIKRLDLEDFNGLMELVGKTMGVGQETGENL